MKKRKAVSLMSGGLDSTLATRIILDQGIEVHGLYLSSPFGCHEEVAAVAESLGIPLQVVEKGSDYLDLVRNPKYGYGKNMNPCIDCRIYMFQLAHQVMDETSADFMITGEVLGQRPMSQRKNAFQIIDRDSEMEDLILRPLSAKHMPPTLPEREGWVDREKLLAISGRGRTEQLALAEDLQLRHYSPPAGGCLLTDENFSERLASFFKTRPDGTLAEAKLLRYGRYFNLDSETFALLGRDQTENEALENFSREEVENGRMVFFKPDFLGPSAVLSGKNLTPNFFDEVGRLILRYSKAKESVRTIDVLIGHQKTKITPLLVPENNPLALIVVPQ
jgi:tRNA U34 2-thiouridine synthase MnmA/TrmU